MLGYHLLDLPFPLVRRIAAWQRDYDDTMNPPYMGDDVWRERHEQDAFNITVSLQEPLGKRYQVEGWLAVDQIVNSQPSELMTESRK